MANKPTYLSHYKALILAGGSGTRLWPVSRQICPKQLMFLTGHTLLADTYQRLSRDFKDKNMWLATSQSQVDIIKSQLPQVKNISVEAEARNTAPAIGLAVLKIWLDDPQALVVTINSDHYIKNEKEYLRVIKTAGRMAAKYHKKIVLVGLKTEYPETGYGYIEAGGAVDFYGRYKLYKVKRFVEKPNSGLAKKYHRHSKFFWNPAIFVFRADFMMELFKKHLPRHYRLLMAIRDNMKNSKKVDQIFKKMSALSIDYGIMEKSHELLVMPASFGWSDIGSWRAVYDILKKGNNHAVQGAKYVDFDSAGNLIYSTTEKIVATIGLNDTAIINTKDALLVVSKDRSQDVREITKILQKKRLKRYL